LPTADLSKALIRLDELETKRTAEIARLGAYALLGVLQTIDALADCFTWTDLSKTPPEKRYYRRLDLR